MPWTSRTIVKHNASLSPGSPRAAKAAGVANAVLRKTGDEGMALATGNKAVAGAKGGRAHAGHPRGLINKAGRMKV